MWCLSELTAMLKQPLCKLVIDIESHSIVYSIIPVCESLKNLKNISFNCTFGSISLLNTEIKKWFMKENYLGTHEKDTIKSHVNTHVYFHCQMPVCSTQI